MMRILRALGCTLAVVLAPSAGFSQGKLVPTDTLIRLERTRCFGSCPAYSVTIDARGIVSFNGTFGVRVTGRQMASIDPRLVSEILEAAERIHFYDLRDRYTMDVTDLPTTFVTITSGGRTKTVEDYIGPPDGLRELEEQIDKAARTKRWVFLDEDTLEQLVRDGWSPLPAERDALFQEAVIRDELAIAQRLLGLGADLKGPPTRRMSPMFMVSSAEMVRFLAAAGADPNESGSGETPLMQSFSRPGEVTAALLQAGARLEASNNGRTALFRAACYGNVSVVIVLLKAGANPRGRIDPREASARECAIEKQDREATRTRTALDRDLDRNRPTVADLDSVIMLLEEAERRLSR